MMIMMNFAVVPKSAWADLPMIQLYSPMNCIYCESEKNRPFFITLVNTVRFLSRVSTLTRDIDIAIVSVRLSVRDVPVSDENGLTHRHSFFSPYGSPIILVLPASNIFLKFRRGHPLRGR